MSKLRVLVIDSDLTGLDFSYRCASAGHNVKLYQTPHKDGSKVWDGFGFPGIERVSSWRNHMAWAKNGLIVNLFNDQKITKELDEFRKFKMPIFGPSVKSAELEWFRGKGMAFMEAHGIEVPKYLTFKTLEEVEKFAWKADQPYCFKTMGDEADKSLTFVPSDPAELVSWIETKKRQGIKLKGPLMLQEKIDMVAEIGISAWMGKEGFLPHYNVNFEFKKNLAGEFGRAVGEEGTVTKYYDENSLATEMLIPFEKSLVELGHFGDFDVGMGVDSKGKLWPFEFSCFDDQTDVLTENGWKRFKDVSLGERMATMDPETEELIFLANTGVLKKSYVGRMIYFGGTSSAPEFMVTPDHQMWVGKTRGIKKIVGKYEFVDAEKCGNNMEIKRGIKSWSGNDAETFILPEYVEKHFLGKSRKYIDLVHPAITMPMKSWMGFLGLMLAEGCLGNYRVSIAQAPHRKHKIREYLDGFGLKIIESKKEFSIHSVQLASYIKSLGWGKQPVRRIPREFMDMSKRHLEIMLDAMIAGDGSVHKRTGQRTYMTSSPSLADDVQEVMLKCGIPARVVKKKVAGTLMTVNGEDYYVRNHDMHIVSERIQRNTGWLDNRLKRNVSYKGYVYCCEVQPHHLLYVRRNGNASWCGNCRFGWPSTPILMACHTCDPAEWMREAVVTGKDLLEVDDRVAIGVIMTRPPYPESADEDPQSTVGYVIEGIEDVWDHVSPWQMMIEDGPIMKNGKVQTGPCYKTSGAYVCTVTALGSDVHDVIPQVYATIDKIKFPDRQVRNDVGKRLENELPKLKALGFEVPDW